MSNQYFLSKSDSSSYASGYEIFLKRTNFREVILKGFSNDLREKLPNSKPLKILDIGCGNGEMTKNYIEILKSNNLTLESLYLLEPSLTALNEAFLRISYLNIPAIKINLPVEDFLKSHKEPKFDLIIASYVFYHLNASCIHELVSMLTPAGTLVIMMGGSDHPLRRDPILKGISKHGDSLNLKSALSHIDNINVKIEEYKTNLRIDGFSGDNTSDEEAKFFSFIYNHDLSQFTLPQLEALKKTITNITLESNKVAHPKHEIIWIQRA